MVALPASQLSANREVKIGLGLVPASLGETVSEHRSTTLGFRLRSLVLKHIPVFDENSIHDAEDIRRDPALWPAMSREASVDDHEIPLGHDHAGPIFQRRRNVLDQTEETIAAGLDMSAVLDVVGRPVALSRHIVSLVEESIEGLEDDSYPPPDSGLWFVGRGFSRLSVVPFR